MHRCAVAYPRVNSLNAVRLVLASLVIVDHARTVGGFGRDPMVGKVSLGALAVFSFFGVSGFLIAGSGLTSTPRQFLANRLVRIFPAFWTCLFVTAFVLSPIAAQGYGAPWSPMNGLQYVLHNLALKTLRSGIGTTLGTAPDPNIWNASLWTLPFEFACYLGVLALAVTGLLRRSWPVYATTALLGLALLPTFSTSVSPAHYAGLATQALELLVMFGAGASVRLCETAVRQTRWPWAFGSGLSVAVGIHWFAHPVPVIAVPLTYLLVWLGAHLPAPGLLRRNDISYGIYIYGMPLQQVLTARGANHLGQPMYLVLCFCVAIPVAVLSWRAVERPALSLKSSRRQRALDVPTRPHRASIAPSRGTQLT